MEHRWDKRLQIAIEVALFHHKIPVAICKTRDIGIEGLFAECGSLVLRNNTLLEVEFEVVSNYSRQRYRLIAITVHICDEGVGLFIRNSESEAAEIWREMVRNAESQKSVDESSPVPVPVFVGS